MHHKAQEIFILEWSNILFNILSPETSKSQTHIFAYVKWAKPHAQQNWFGQSAAVCENDYEDSSFCNYLPLQRIVSICAHAYLELKFTAYTDNVLVAIPSIALSSAQICINVYSTMQLY